MRDTLWREWNEFNAFGRIYLAREGINAQLSIPVHCFEDFRVSLFKHKEFENVPFKIAVEDDGKSFCWLTIKVKRELLLMELRTILLMLQMLGLTCLPLNLIPKWKNQVRLS